MIDKTVEQYLVSMWEFHWHGGTVTSGRPKK